MKFVAYGYEKSCANGIAFLVLVVMWLRAYGIDDEIIFQMDWGEEWGGTSLRKLSHIEKRILKPLNARMVKIPKGRAYKNGIVERLHRIEDEEFYIPYLEEIGSFDDFLRKAAYWTHLYNFSRPHFGRNMNGKTPYEKLSSTKPEIKKDICLFPPYLLDRIIPIYSHISFAEKITKRGHTKGGNDLYVQYTPLIG